MEPQEEKKEETRETIELITPKKNHKVILRTYLIGSEIRVINKADRNLDKEKDNEDNIGRMEIGMINALVVSIDGKTDDILKTILSMCGGDYKFLMKKIDNIVKEDFLDPAENTKKE